MLYSKVRIQILSLIIPLLSILMLVQLAQATVFPLSGAMLPERDVLDFILSHDGHTAVYRADYETDNAYELYAVPLYQGTPIRLSSLLPTGTAVADYAITPNNVHVVYIAPQDDPDVNELYVVPIDGPASSSKKLNLPLTGGNVLDFQISADSQFVVFRAVSGEEEEIELFIAPISANQAAIKLNDPLTNGGDVTAYQISPDPAHPGIVYLADQHENNVFELFSVTIDGSSAVQLNGPLTTNGSVSAFQISPSNGYVVYLANQEDSQVNELYRTTLTNDVASPVKLNPPLALGGDVSEFSISADGQFIVYLADQDVNDRLELYSVETSGTALDGTKLNGALVTSSGTVMEYQISPDADRVVYRAVQQTGDVIELYSVPITGPSSASVKINSPLTENGHVAAFDISSDGEWVVYKADQDEPFEMELYGVQIFGPTGSAVKLNSSLTNNGDVNSFSITADSRWVYYLADQDQNDVTELFRAPLATANQAIRINSTLSGSRDVTLFGIAVDGGRVVYLADQLVDEQFEMFVADDNRTAVSFKQPSVTIEESAGLYQVTVGLAASSILPVTVDYAVTGGTAVANFDYYANDGQFKFLPGETEKTFTLTTIDNDYFNENKTIFYTLSNPDNATIVPYSTLTIILRNDDYFLFLPAILHE